MAIPRAATPFTMEGRGGAASPSAGGGLSPLQQGAQAAIQQAQPQGQLVAPGDPSQGSEAVVLLRQLRDAILREGPTPEILNELQQFQTFLMELANLRSEPGPTETPGIAPAGPPLV